VRGFNLENLLKLQLQISSFSTCGLVTGDTKQEPLCNLNDAVKNHNRTAGKKRLLGLATERELAIFIAIILTASPYGRTGQVLWKMPQYDTMTEAPGILKLTEMSY
jgi:hypothetical protein